MFKKHCVALEMVDDYDIGENIVQKLHKQLKNCNFA